MKLKTLVIIACLIFWPTSLFLANTASNFFHYLVPAAFLTCFYLLYKKGRVGPFHTIPLLAIPFFEPKLALLPILAFLFLSKSKINIISLLISLLIFVTLFSQFKSQTVFHPDHNAYQQVIQNTRLYDNVFEARLMHNKARVYLDKINDNFFALTDLNNYFTSFHPREIIIDNQNLKKFPLLSIVFFILAFLNLKTTKNNRFIITIFLALLINLSLLAVFDRTDFVLYPIFALLLFHGIDILSKHKHAPLFYFLFLIFAIPEFLKIIIDLTR